MADALLKDQYLSPAAGPAGESKFTIDGSPELELMVGSLCAQIRQAVVEEVPAIKINGLVLGGGYGRGEGGVLRQSGGDAPYNDLEFYLFLSGNRFWNERRYGSPLNRRCDRLSDSSALHLEIKIDDLEGWSGAPVSMFSYDVVARHRIIHGPADLFKNCRHHRRAEEIPLEEATRLLFNRCGGLLLSLERLRRPVFSPADSDFVARNVAKAQLTLGDVALVAARRYHWSCLERRRRLRDLAAPDGFPRFTEVREHHGHGAEFKLHPVRSTASRKQLWPRFESVAAIAREVWFWLERRRLNEEISDYAAHPGVLCRAGDPLTHWLQNLRSFGLAGAASRFGARYPRERLMRALVPLLWEPEACESRPRLAQLQSLLATRSAAWSDLVRAYERTWPCYG